MDPITNRLMCFITSSWSANETSPLRPNRASPTPWMSLIHSLLRPKYKAPQTSIKSSCPCNQSHLKICCLRARLSTSITYWETQTLDRLGSLLLMPPRSNQSREMPWGRNLTVQTTCKTVLITVMWRTRRSTLPALKVLTHSSIINLSPHIEPVLSLQIEVKNWSYSRNSSNMERGRQQAEIQQIGPKIKFKVAATTSSTAKT